MTEPEVPLYRLRSLLFAGAFIPASTPEQRDCLIDALRAIARTPAGPDRENARARFLHLAAEYSSDPGWKDVLPSILTLALPTLTPDALEAELASLPAWFSDVQDVQAALRPHPTLLPAITAKAPNDPAMRALYRGMARKDEPASWPLNENDGQRYYEEPGGRVIYRPAEVFQETDWWASMREDTLRALDKRFRAMRGDLVADVVDVLFLHWLANGEPAKAGITLAQVLKYRQKKPSKAEYELHWEALRDARSIRIQDDSLDAALFDMDAARGLQRNLFGWDTPPAADVVYVYAPGFFVGRAVSTSHQYVAAYTPKILGLDPYRDKTAKQVARYLRGEWRLNPGGYLHGASPRFRSWAEHLADSGIDPQGSFSGHPEMFVKALERELGKLYDAEALGESPFDNPNLYHPEDRNRTLPRRNWLPAFLAQRVHLPPIAEVQDALVKTHARRKALEAQQAALPKPGKRKRGKAK